MPFPCDASRLMHNGRSESSVYFHPRFTLAMAPVAVKTLAFLKSNHGKYFLTIEASDHFSHHQLIASGVPSANFMLRRSGLQPNLLQASLSPASSPLHPVPNPALTSQCTCHEAPHGHVHPEQPLSSCLLCARRAVNQKQVLCASEPVSATRVSTWWGVLAPDAVESATGTHYPPRGSHHARSSTHLAQHVRKPAGQHCAPQGHPKLNSVPCCRRSTMSSATSSSRRCCTSTARTRRTSRCTSMRVAATSYRASRCMTP